MLYDVHTHAFHPKIAHKVLEQLNGHYGIQAIGNGTAEDLAQRVTDAGLDRFVVHTAATAPEQVIPANNWAIDLAQRFEQAIPFGSVHPGFEGWEAQLDKLESHGIKGLKIHPEFQQFWLDDPALEPIFEAARGRFTIMVHVGDKAQPQDNPSCPYKLMQVAKNFPGLTLIAAHMGGYLHWKWALDELIGSDVYIDTSSTIPYIDDATLAEIFRRHPRERILFGSDYPLFDPGTEAQRLKLRLGFSDAEVEELMTNPAQLFES
ncbi:amidohydrolase family protein [Desulfovibrio ferrophilus]|nr:amidohydrolase family protein [Desulfovibrio ferrophilus]